MMTRYCPLKRWAGYVLCAASLSAGWASTAIAATLKTLHTFSLVDDGIYIPGGGLIESEGVLYGVTKGLDGAVYALNTDGSGFEVIHTFVNAPGAPTTPTGKLLSLNSVLYGETFFGGKGAGTYFSLATDGSAFDVLRNFSTMDVGKSPNNNGLVTDGTTLYGLSLNGGVFSSDLDGSNYKDLHFQQAATGRFGLGALVEHNGVLYGSMTRNGLYNHGTLFSLNTDGSNFQVLHHFGSVPNDGGFPAQLLLLDSTLYGVTAGDAASIFRISLDGSGYQRLHTFAEGGPVGGLTNIGTTLYGLMATGTNGDEGQVYGIQTDGSGFHQVQSFSSGNGTQLFPIEELVAKGSTLFGVTLSGGPNGEATVFAVTVPEPSTMLLAATASFFLAIATWKHRAATTTRAVSEHDETVRQYSRPF